MSFTEKLNMTCNLKEIPSRAVVINTRNDTAYYDTICLYCANNNIDTNKIDDNDFYSASIALENFVRASVKEYDKVAFWFD